jgi:hypothetical protein
VALIPLAPSPLIDEQLIRLLDREEASLVAGRAIRVELLGQAPMRGLDLVEVRHACDPEDAIGVGQWLGGSHGFVCRAVRSVR